MLSPYGDGRASERIVEVLKTGALHSAFHLDTQDTAKTDRWQRVSQTLKSHSLSRQGMQGTAR